MLFPRRRAIPVGVIPAFIAPTAIVLFARAVAEEIARKPLLAFLLMGSLLLNHRLVNLLVTQGENFIVFIVLGLEGELNNVLILHSVRGAGIGILE